MLRIIAATAGDQIIFKGGTSLSKGWNLIQRFSEDIDTFLDPLRLEPALTKRGIDRELKRRRDAVAVHPALEFLPEESQTIGGFGRNDRFSYEQPYGGRGEVANRVLLEAGAASGRQPTAHVKLRSYLSRFLTFAARPRKLIGQRAQSQGGCRRPALPPEDPAPHGTSPQNPCRLRWKTLAFF